MAVRCRRCRCYCSLLLLPPTLHIQSFHAARYSHVCRLLLCSPIAPRVLTDDGVWVEVPSANVMTLGGLLAQAAVQASDAAPGEGAAVAAGSGRCGRNLKKQLPHDMHASHPWNPLVQRVS